MADLLQKYPKYSKYIQDMKKVGFSDMAIENAIMKAGEKPKMGKTFDGIKDSSFADVISEKFSIEPGESFLEFIGDVAGIPQVGATAGLAKMFGESESFKSMFARGVQPSEFAPKDTPGSIKFVADLLLDPLNLAVGAGLVSKVGKGLKAGSKFIQLTKAAKEVSGAEKAVKTAVELAKLGKDEWLKFAKTASTEDLYKVVDDLKDLAFKGDTQAAFARDIIKQEAGLTTGKIGIKEIVDLGSEGLSSNVGRINKEVQIAFHDVWRDLAVKGRVPIIDPKVKPFIHQMKDAVDAGLIDFEGDLVNAMVKKGIPKERAVAEIVGSTVESVSESARELARQRMFLSKVQKSIKDNPALDDVSKALNDMLSDLDNSAFLTGWKRLDNLRRGMLVTQLATAQRNAITQAGRVGLDTIEQGIQAGLQKLFGRPQTAHPADTFAVFSEILKQLKHPIKAFKGQISDADKILALHPKLNNRLFNHYASDIYTGQGKAERVVDLLNTANRFQEWTTRRAVFTGKLRTLLRNEGKSLNEIIKANRMNEIPERLLRSAIDDALEITFAQSPKYGSVAHAFTNFINKMPGATFAIPFPRFMVNSMKFFWDFSPMGVLKLVKSSEWAKMATGDFKSISRAMLGTGMLGAAWQVRNSEYAGEKWYEVRLPDGKTWDTRAYNPFAAYLFAADVIKKAKDGTLNQLKSKDIMMGVLSSNLRAGSGLYILDSFLEGIAGLKTPDKAVTKLKEFSGEVVGGFFTPLQTLTDVISEFDEKQQIVRDRRTEPFMGPIKAHFPVISKQMEPMTPVTREEPFRRIGGALRQLTGVTLNEPKNMAERELDRLGFTYMEIVRPTGVDEADRLIKKYMGKLVQERVSKLVTSENYLRLSNASKGEKLRLFLNKMREIARKRAKRENPGAFKKVKELRIPRRKRMLLEEIAGGQE